MSTARLPTLCALSGRCQYQSVPSEQVWTCLQWWPDVTMGGGIGTGLQGSHVRRRAAGDPMSDVWGLMCDDHGEGGAGDLNSEVQCIMGNGRMGTSLWTDTHTCENITFSQLRWRTVNIKSMSFLRTMIQTWCFPQYSALLSPKMNFMCFCSLFYWPDLYPMLQKSNLRANPIR